MSSSRARLPTSRAASTSHSRTNSLKLSGSQTNNPTKHSVLETEITKQLDELSKLNARLDRSLAKLSTYLAINPAANELFRRIDDDRAKIKYINQLIVRLMDAVEDQSHDLADHPNGQSNRSRPNSGTSTPVRHPTKQSINQSLARWKLSLERESRRSERTLQSIDQSIKQLRKADKANRNANIQSINQSKQPIHGAFNGNLGERLINPADQTPDDDDDDEDEQSNNQLVEFIDLDEQLIEQRVKELRMMEQEVRDVAQLFVQVNDLVQEQQVSVDQIDESIEHVAVTVDKGVEQIVQADVSHRKSRRCQCVVGVTVLLVLAGAAAVVIFILKH